MAVIKTEHYDKIFISIKIYAKPNDSTKEQDIAAIKNILKDTCLIVIKLTSVKTFTITEGVFDNCVFNELVLDNVILSEKAIDSISDRTREIRINCDQPYFHTLMPQRVVVYLNDEYYKVPDNIRNLKIKGKNDITIYCHDNLETFYFSAKATAILVNCNNLRKLVLDNESYVHGEFLDYIGQVEINQYSIVGKDDYFCYYLSLFKNLQCYEGHIDREILSALAGVKRISGNAFFDVTIDDLPDSFEDMEFILYHADDIESIDILTRKPNIKKLYYRNSNIGAEGMAEMYPDIYFYLRPCHEDVSALVRNNKKLTRLVDLC